MRKRLHKFDVTYPAGNYMFKASNRSNRTRYEICSKLTTKTPEPRQWRRSGIFIVNFEQVNADWVRTCGKYDLLDKKMFN